MTVAKKQMVLRLPTQSFERLKEWAQQIGKTPESLTQEILEHAIEEQSVPIRSTSRATRQILQAAGRIRPLSPSLRKRIIPGVTLAEVQSSLDRAGGQPLSEIILQQRGTNP